jgi:hypothetical protein
MSKKESSKKPENELQTVSGVKFKLHKAIGRSAHLPFKVTSMLGISSFNDQDKILSEFFVGLGKLDNEKTDEFYQVIEDLLQACLIDKDITDLKKDGELDLSITDIFQIINLVVS